MVSQGYLARPSGESGGGSVRGHGLGLGGYDVIRCGLGITTIPTQAMNGSWTGGMRVSPQVSHVRGQGRGRSRVQDEGTIEG